MQTTLAHPLGILTIQENVTVSVEDASATQHDPATGTAKTKKTENTTTCAHLIASALGSEFRVLSNETKDSRLATVYNSRLFQLVGEPIVFELPRLAHLPLWNKLFIKSGQIEQKNALVCDFQWCGSAPPPKSSNDLLYSINVAVHQFSFGRGGGQSSPNYTNGKHAGIDVVHDRCRDHCERRHQYFFCSKWSASQRSQHSDRFPWFPVVRKGSTRSKCDAPPNALVFESQ
jgi:hypothetical protein